MNEGPIPPPQENYAAYPRASTSAMYGTSDKLLRLYRGYTGSTYTFLMGLLSYALMFPGSLLIQQKGYEILGGILFLLPIAGVVGVFYFSIRAATDIAYGTNMQKSSGILIGIVTPFMCVIMCAVMGYLATTEIKRYGIKSRFFGGIKSVEIQAAVHNLKLIEQGVVATPPSNPVTFQA